MVRDRLPGRARRRALQAIAAVASVRLGQVHRGVDQFERLLEAQRLEQRTNFDIEMMEEMGFCSGIENYSRHLAGRAPGEWLELASSLTFDLERRIAAPGAIVHPRAEPLFTLICRLVRRRAVARG